MAIDRLAKVVTPLGDSLLLQSLVGHEELSRPFDYELVLLSTDASIKPSSLLGQSVTVEVEVEELKTRYYNGIVSRFVRGGSVGRHSLYRATLRPWIWLLSRTADCKIFQNMTVPDVIKQVFRGFGLSDFDDALSGSYRTWDYVVQYRETALAFVSRLMEQEGIYYYFRHESGKHMLVLADGYSAHAAAPGYEEVPFFPPETPHLRERDHLNEWSASEQIQPGAYMLNDFDFTRPKASLQAKTADPRDHARADMEIYDYPGEYSESGDGDNYVKARLHALLAEHEQLEGQGNVRGLAVGNLFKLTQFPMSDQNREYLVVGSHHVVENNTRESSGGGETRVSASIHAIDSRTQYRPAQLTPKPLISGPQTAIVVGKAGEEIWTDQYGRVKVQFHWDRLGKSDENSSCWVRVAQVWAGGRWGAMHIPRIGQEVIVEFLEGDPDRPIITGRVYNGDNKPPYDLPANQTQSGLKSRSTKGGNPDNFNELRFEDKKGEEHVYLQAEKDYQIYVKHDESRKIDNDRFKEVLKNESVKVGVDRTEEVGANETITIGADQTITVHANQTLTVDANQTIGVLGQRTESVAKTETVSIDLARTHTVGGSDTLSVALAQTISVDGARSVSVGKDQSVDISGNHSLSVSKNETTSITGKRSTDVGKDESLQVTGQRTTQIGKNDSLDVAKKLLISAGDEIVIRTGDASITMKKNGDITISGKNITLKGGGKINAKADGDIVLKGKNVNQN
jgi:type VI secretion system secreted protein VgrG